MTYDLKTIPHLFRIWAASERHHAGVILIDVRTISQGDIGGQLRALVRLIELEAGTKWTDRVQYLKPG